MDPALIGFSDKKCGSRICDKDAKNVEIIHTAGGIIGFSDPIGHADFYPNGGSIQKGCSFPYLSCSHGRAYEYFAESINSEYSFCANKCNKILGIIEICVGPNMIMGGIKKRIFPRGKSVPETNDYYPFGFNISKCQNKKYKNKVYK